MMRIQRYDQCGEYIDGYDVQVKYCHPSYVTS